MSSDGIRGLLRPLAVRVANSIARAVVQLVDDATGLQGLQLGVLDGEDLDECERFQEYGFYSVPLVGAEAVVVFPNGDRGHPLVVAVDDRRYRPTGGDAGEVCVYNHTGANVKITAAGDIVLTPAAGKKIKLGSASADLGVALWSDLQTLADAIDGAVVVAGDGGASLKSTLMAALAAWPTCSSKVNAE